MLSKNVLSKLTNAGSTLAISAVILGSAFTLPSWGMDTDINRPRVGHWENRGNTPNEDDIKLLSFVFGVNETDIVPEGCRKR